MRKHMLIAITALLGYSANAQVITKGTNFISANGSVNYDAPSEEKVTINGVPTTSRIQRDKGLSYLGAITYNRFLKDNLAFGVGIYSDYNEVTYSNQTIYNDSNYSKNRTDQSSRESGITLSMQRFYPVWKEKVFVTFNTALAGGLIQSDNASSYESQNGISPWSQSSSLKTEGVSARLSTGAGAYFFINKHWVLSTSVSAFNVNVQHFTTTSINDTYGFSTPANTKTEIETNRITGSLNPFVQPFNLIWGVNYFF